MHDNGEVLPGLDEPWTFMGANAMEWSCGLVVFLMIGSFARTPASAMPLMLAGWVCTTVMMASTRRLHPDQERGVRNSILTACGFPPPGVPAPARIQPVWSNCPSRTVNKKWRFTKVGLDELLPSFQGDLFDPEV